MATSPTGNPGMISVDGSKLDWSKLMFYGDGLYRREISGLSVTAQGLYTARPIASGQMITEYAGVVIPRKKTVRLEEEKTSHDAQLDKTSHIVSLGHHAQLDGRNVEPAFGVPCAQWANNPFGDQQPNVQFVRTTSPAVKGVTRGGDMTTSDRVWLRGLRSIQPGEELLASYGLGFWRQRVDEKEVLVNAYNQRVEAREEADRKWVIFKEGALAKLKALPRLDEIGSGQSGAISCFVTTSDAKLLEIARETLAGKSITVCIRIYLLCGGGEPPQSA